MSQKYRHTVLVWRNRAKKAEVHLKINLPRDMKVNRKGFRTGISASKGKLRKYGHTAEWARGVGDRALGKRPRYSMTSSC